MPEYKIEEKTYTQKPLVLGQWKQLLELLKGLTVPAGVDAIGLAGILGDKLPLALAIVMNPDGVPLKDKDLPAIADELEFSLDPETLIQVIEDFFACNPLPSILAKLSQAAGILTGKMPKETPSTGSSLPSPEGTSPSEMESSGG